MSILSRFAKLRVQTRRGRPVAVAVMMVASLMPGSFAFATPTSTTGDITGVVTDQSGVGVAGIKVDVHAYGDPSGEIPGHVTWTEAGGVYDISGVDPGAYQVDFNGQPALNDPGAFYTEQQYDHRGNNDNPDPVDVTAGQTTGGINASLERAGIITGKVVDDNGNPIPNMKIDATVADQSIPAGWTTWTYSDGTYNLSGVPEGSYMVQFNNMPGPGEANAYYTQQLYSQQPYYGTPDTVNVTTGQITPNINATLHPAGAISGRIVDQDGVGISGVKLSAYASLDDYNNPGQSLDSGMAFSDENGNFFFGGLPASQTYLIDENGPGDNDPYHLEQFYKSQAGADTFTPVVVVNNQTTSGINDVMPTLGVISGTITDTTGAPAQAVISAYATANDFYNNTPVRATVTNSDGTYSLIDLPVGKYFIAFTPQAGYFYVPQFYNNQPTIGTAGLVAAAKGAETQNINATLGSLSGTTGSIEAHTNKLRPALMGPDSDQLPGITITTDNAKADVNVQNKNQGPAGGVTFTYANNGHSLKLTSKSISQFFEFGSNNSSAGFTGTATLTVDGVTTTNPFSVVVVDGSQLNPKGNDQFGIYIWAVGANPSTSTPIYYLNKPLPNGNVVVK